jgi:hypothetical protein
MIAECKRLRDICVGPYKETLTSLTADGEIIINAPSANRLPVDTKSGGQPLAKPGRGSQPLAKNKHSDLSANSSSVRRSPRKAARMPLTEMRAVRKMETVLPRTVPATAATFRPGLSGSSRTRRLLTGGDSRDSTPDSAAG